MANKGHDWIDSSLKAALGTRDLRRLNRLAGVGLLSATIAHEIKNALVPLKTHLGLMVERYGETELTSMARRELERIEGLAGRMLKGAQPRGASFSPVHLHEVLDQTLSLVQKESAVKLIDIERAYDAPRDEISGDTGELQQAFLNLFLNAIEAMRSGGKLVIVTKRGTFEGTASPNITVCVSDTGTGITTEHLQRLFQPFFTTKPNGTGLGLLITKQIVEEHSGAIRVESTPGKSTVFCLDLPLIEDAR